MISRIIHSREGHDRGSSRPLAWAPALGHSRTTIKFHAPQSVSGCVAEGARTWRPRDSRRCFPRQQLGGENRLDPENRSGECFVPSAKMPACFPVPTPSLSILGTKSSPVICSSSCPMAVIDGLCDKTPEKLGRDSVAGEAKNEVTFSLPEAGC